MMIIIIPDLFSSTVTIDFKMPYVITIMSHLPAFSIGSQTRKKKFIHPHEKTENVVIRHPLQMESDGPILIHQHVHVNFSSRLSDCPSSIIKATLCAHIRFVIDYNLKMKSAPLCRAY